jgi:hypothetical protein
MTQDGPAHLYNAHILAQFLEPQSPFRDVYEVRWEPLPNWAGHIVTMLFVSMLPPSTAGRAVTTLTLVAFAFSLLWLRWKVAGRQGLALASVIATLLALNVAWLLGFTSFLLGASLFPVTLATWWSGRDQGWAIRRVIVLSTLLVLGYFCHLVSLGLTVIGLGVLELLTPGPKQRGRATVTVIALVPLVPLALNYLRLMKAGGGLSPQWTHLRNPLSLASWVSQLSWIDPISLARRDYLPLIGVDSRWCWLILPVAWLGIALVLASSLPARLLVWDQTRDHQTFPEVDRSERFTRDDCPGRRSELRAWWVLSGVLLIGGIAGPDTLGAEHGDYLQQRIVLLGLAALIPVLRLEPRGRLGRICVMSAVVALAVQSAIVWDYAQTSERTAGTLCRASRFIGKHKRIGTLLTGIRTPFRANPLLHADCSLGIGTGNIVWANYEARHYYFPIQVRRNVPHPDPYEFEAVALAGDHPDEARTLRWRELLEHYESIIDTLVVWGDDPALDEVNARWFERVASEGRVVVVAHREVTSLPSSTGTGANPDRPP